MKLQWSQTCMTDVSCLFLVSTQQMSYNLFVIFADWNISNISCLRLSQLVGSTADVKTLPNGFFHISQSATSDFFWIFLYLMGFQLLLISHLFLHKQITKTGNWIEKYQFWGFHQSLGFDKTFIVGLCCCIWAITSQRNVLYTVWPLTKDKKAFN